MKLLFLTRKWSPATGGMETYALKFVEYMSRDLPLVVIHPENCKTGRPSLPFLFSFYSRAVWQVLTQARTCTHFHLGDGALYPFSFLIYLLTGQRSHITFHGLDIQYTQKPTALGRLYRLYMYPLRWAPIACAFPNSRYTASLLPPIPQQVVTLGTDLPWSPNSTAYRSKHLIVYVGRVIPRKGAVWFAQHVLPYLPNTEFLVVGPAEPSDIALLKSCGAHYGGVQTGQRLHELRSSASLFVVPNITKPAGDGEGFGLVCVENARYGVPVLASDWQGLKDAILPGVTGYLLPPESEASWVSKIKQIQLWSPEQCGAFQAQSAGQQDHFTWDRVIQEMLATYRTG